MCVCLCVCVCVCVCVCARALKDIQADSIISGTIFMHGWYKLEVNTRHVRYLYCTTAQCVYLYICSIESSKALATFA